jgi:predicted DNA-binding transcriptional regulator AlpA
MSLMTQGYLLDTYGPRLGVDALCAVLGLSKSTINNQISAQAFPIPTYREAGKRWADYRDVDAYLERCREMASA